MTTSSLLNPAYKNWLESKINPYETILLLEKAEVSEVDLSDISDALEEYVRLFKAEIASPAEILTLSRAYPDEEKYSLAVIDKELDQKEPVVVGGPASVEVVDREGHIITVDAMKRAFDRFMENFRTRNAMVLHSDVQVGWALPAYISKTGKIYKSGVTGDHLFFITELRDDTKISKKVLEQIETGKMKSYSIAGSATSVEPSKRDGGVVMQVNDMELAEVTICEQGVNQRAKFELMKSDTDRPTSSCVDGSCLIKSQEHKHSETEIFMNSNGEIDTVGSFTNWVQKQSIYDDPEDRQTPEQASKRRAENREMVEREQGERMQGTFSGPRPDSRRIRRKPKEEPKGKEILEMKKNSLEQLDDYLVEKGIGDIARGSFTNWVQKGEGMKSNKSSTDILYAYLHKEIYNDPESSPSLGPSAQPSHGSGGSAAALNRQRVEARKGKKPPSKYRGAPLGYERRTPPDEEPKGKEILEMQKSHLEGCLCDSCKQRTGDTNGDDTPRMATDRHGRPTLGHTGHGHAVAILISRMHRKGDVVPFESQDDKDTRETVEKTRRITYNYIAANPNTFPDHHKNTDFSKPYDPETDSGLKPAIQHHQQASKKTDSDGDKPTMNMAKAVYQFIHKFGAMGKPGKAPKPPGDASKVSGVPENPGQQIAEAKKKDAATSTPQTQDFSRRRGLLTQGRDAEGRKTGSWFGNLIRDAESVHAGRGEHTRTQAAATQPTMNMEKDVKSLAGGSGWKQHKQGIPRASQRKRRQGWDQQSGVGGSNQAIGFREMSKK